MGLLETIGELLTKRITMQADAWAGVVVLLILLIIFYIFYKMMSDVSHAL
jgi:uncharacterized membrane protein YvbJ